MAALVLPTAHADDDVDALVRTLAGGATDPCVVGAGDELVLRLGPGCPVASVSAVVRDAIARQDRRAPARRSGKEGCRSRNDCRDWRSNAKLNLYSSFAHERTQAGAGD